MRDVELDFLVAGDLGGGAVLDECGECGGDGIADGTCDCAGNVTDCADVCGGSAYVDECGTCDDDGSNDCVQDCAGVWGGSAAEELFYLDIDADGLGSGTGYELCNGLDLTGWVTNDNDEDDNCYSNTHDCAGVCDGSSEVK